MNKFKTKDGKDGFVVYAHRGASHYCPENTLMSFYMGVRLGANGIETDVQRTKDGVLVLFHDDTLDRVTGFCGAVSDYTYGELCRMYVKEHGLFDIIPTLEDFLDRFAFRDITLALELKVGGMEADIRALLYKYGMAERTVVTSFNLDYLKAFKVCAPEIRIGYLTVRTDGEVAGLLRELGAYEICPKGELLTPELVKEWHGEGLNVRAWGIFNTDIMKQVYDAGADGMTVNFPDLLIEYINGKK